ncbi:MAG: cupin domain-containing protein [Lysinibacillus sp.]
MEIYSFKKACGKRITHYDSDFVMTRILQTSAAASMGVMYLEEGGLVGYHQTTTPQLLLIVSGTGYVSIDQQEYIPVGAGDAVFWQRGEWHETKTDTGLTAFVIEGAEVNPFLLR